MANTIRIKRSSVAGKIPTLSDVSAGELAVNIADGKLFTRKETGGVASIVEIGGSAGGGGVTTGIVTYNEASVTTNLVLNASYNGVSVGPIEIGAGVTVEVPQTTNWAII